MFGSGLSSLGITDNMYILQNARVYTMDESCPTASAVAVRNGRFVSVGDDQSVLSDFKEIDSISIVDLGGKVLLPGLIDAHLHLKKYALGLQKVNCETETKAECLRRVSNWAKKQEPGTWILGHGWNQNEWLEGFGTTDDLDQITSEHPIFLTAKSLHAGWANSMALRIASISKNTEDPINGVIQRDDLGEPTGILLEKAMKLVADVVDQPNLFDIEHAIDRAQSNLWRVGVTGVHDFDRRECFIALQRLHQDNKLHLRVLKSIPIDDLEFAVGLGLRSGFGDDMLRIGSLKMFSDGALGPRTAAMTLPYESEPGNLGMLLKDGEEIFESGRIAVENGLSLAIHAIGDRANHEVLNAFEGLRAYEESLFIENRNNSRDAADGISALICPRLRHRIEHVQLIHPDDVHRLEELDIIASMQPIHATSDMLMSDKYWGERSKYAYAWNMIKHSGTRLAFGSDAPVDSPNPFWGIHAAVTRQRRDGTPSDEGWYGAQKVSVFDAIGGFTTGAAYASLMEDRLGKIKTGYLADFIVLGVDPFNCDPDSLYRIEPLATVVGGEWVYQREDLF
jgi:predicted amidohydrolase YtcJ